MPSTIFGLKKQSSQTTNDSNDPSSEAYEGQLALDVYQTDDNLIIKAPIAGVKLKDINITITDDVLTIKGSRMIDEEILKDKYYTQECYWGPFSRSIILPGNVETEKTAAHFKDGILKIVIPKSPKIKPKVVSIEPD